MPHNPPSDVDVNDVMNYITLTQTLVDSFNALASEVQSLTDRKTVLEHKLRFAHEQYQYLADKYAPAAPEIAETLAKLQLPPDLRHPMLEDATSVPLPQRNKLDTRNQIALTIRDGRRVANQLAALVEPSKTSLSSRETFSAESRSETSPSTVLEQDFTIEGKKGMLQCPFSTAATSAAGPASAGGGRSVERGQVAESGSQQPDQDPTPHQSSDPICAAMFEESMSQPAPTTNGSTAAAKCPIRYLDKHSPEEIAHYVETHKHELPRSHEVCVRRYQRNEDQIKKLDAKYGNLVSMIQGLSTLHKPMLPTPQEQQEIDKASNERVETWAQAVTSSVAEGHHEGVDGVPDQESTESESEPERESHFDRPLKEVRVGESPSRPWGIHVPVYELNSAEEAEGPPLSPPPAPVMMPTSSEGHPSHPTPAKTGGGKCPFDHTKMAAAMQGLNPPTMAEPSKPDGDMPLDHHLVDPVNPAKERAPQYMPPQPAFINPPTEMTKTDGVAPQMVFTGPVFIGYPIEQAIQFMQHFQGRQ